MTNYQTGHQAEKDAAEYLESKGYKIMQLNWKTKYCEIDIVARKKERIYFVEVKYRQTRSQGFSLEYITPKKLNQMRFAAEIWVSNHSWTGEYQLAAIGIDGEEITLVEDL